MLLIASINRRDTWNVYNILVNKVLDMQNSIPTTWFCGSFKGWLEIVEKDYSVSLVNAFSKVILRKEKQNSSIRLSPLLDCFIQLLAHLKIMSRRLLFQQIQYQMQKIVLSCMRFQLDSLLLDLRKRQILPWLNEFFMLESDRDEYYAVGTWNKLISFDITTPSNSYIKEISCGFSYICW